MSIRYDKKGFDTLICNFVSWYISQLSEIYLIEYKFEFIPESHERVFEVTKFNFSRTQVIHHHYVLSSSEDINMLDYLYDINELNCFK